MKRKKVELMLEEAKSDRPITALASPDVTLQTLEAAHPDAKLDGEYDVCLHCPALGISCDGPNLLSMSLFRWCVWCSRLIVIRGYTYAYVAEQSGYSLRTVINIMTWNPPKDIFVGTMAAISRVLIGSSGKWPCAKKLTAEAECTIKELTDQNEALMDQNEVLGVELAEATLDRDKLRETLAGIHASYQAELDAVRAESQRKIDHLKAEVEHLRADSDRKSQIIDRLLDK